jgi:class 3 adenylate cyclase
MVKGMRAAGSLPHGTVTFLFTDIEGSTRLLERLGRARYREVLETHRELLRRAVVEAGGAEVDSQRDSLFVAFVPAPKALVRRCSPR